MMLLQSGVVCLYCQRELCSFSTLYLYDQQGVHLNGPLTFPEQHPMAGNVFLCEHLLDMCDDG